MPRQTNVINAFETLLSAEFGSDALTAQWETVQPFPATPCYLVFDPLSDAGGREYILFDGSSSSTSISTSTLDNRYLSGSSALGGITHPAGTLVRMSPLQQHIDDLNSRIDDRLLASAHTKALHDAMGIAHSSLAGLTSGDPHSQYLTSGRHGEIDHSDKLTVVPAGRKILIQSSAPSSGLNTNDLWVNTAN